jgi:alcohol dehydrogenase class IV
MVEHVLEDDIDPGALAARIRHLLQAAAIPQRLADMTVTAEKIPAMSEMAANQWTAQFNPRQMGVEDFSRLYESAM